MRSARHAPPGAKQTGITLVETLVSLTVGLAIVSVAFNLYTSNRTVFKQVEGVARLQESARVAAALLTADIRQAGGSLCRNGLPTTNIVNSSEWWTQPDKGIQGFDSSTTDSRASSTSYPRIAGDSFTVWSSNSGAAKLLYETRVRGQYGDYPRYLNWTLDLKDTSGFSAGDLIVICDYTRALIAQATVPFNGTLIVRYTYPGSPYPGQCGTAFSAKSARIEALPSCNADAAAYAAGMPSGIPQDYTWDTGSMVGTLTAHHWYVGNKTNALAGSLNNRALRRLTINYNRTGRGSISATSTTDEMVENVSDMQIRYLVGNASGYANSATYVAANAVTDWTKVIAVRILLTLTSTEAVGVGAGQAASAASYTVPINVAIRSRLPSKVARF
jgi:type IV pilus assembly protein PilW